MVVLTCEAKGHNWADTGFFEAVMNLTEMESKVSYRLLSVGVGPMEHMY